MLVSEQALNRFSNSGPLRPRAAVKFVADIDEPLLCLFIVHETPVTSEQS